MHLNIIGKTGIDLMSSHTPMPKTAPITKPMTFFFIVSGTLKLTLFFSRKAPRNNPEHITAVSIKSFHNRASTAPPSRRIAITRPTVPVIVATITHTFPKFFLSSYKAYIFFERAMENNNPSPTPTKTSIGQWQVRYKREMGTSIMRMMETIFNHVFFEYLYAVPQRAPAVVEWPEGNE